MPKTLLCLVRKSNLKRLRNHQMIPFIGDSGKSKPVMVGSSREGHRSGGGADSKENCLRQWIVLATVCVSDYTNLWVC